MQQRNLATVLSFALALAFPVGVSAHPGAGSTKHRSESVEPMPAGPSAPSRGSQTEDLRYAERERSSPDAKRYRAGDTVVISATVAIIVLLGIIIIILVT
jgi:hypothetical protein